MSAPTLKPQPVDPDFYSGLTTNQLRARLAAARAHHRSLRAPLKKELHAARQRRTRAKDDVQRMMAEMVVDRIRDDIARLKADERRLLKSLRTMLARHRAEKHRAR